MGKQYHIIYKTTNLKNGKIYIGKHSTYNLNDGYLGSGIRLKRAIRYYGKENFKREILEFFNNENDCYLKESELVNTKFVKRKDTYNLKPGGEGGFNNKITLKDINGNIFRVDLNDPRYLSGELLHVSTDMITVKDKDNNTMSVNRNDPRYLSGELVGVNKNMITVKDKDNNTMSVNRNDPRYLSGELISIHKNMITVKDKDNNSFKVSINDPRYLSGELKSPIVGKFSAKDEEGNIFLIDKNDPRYLSGELVGVNKNIPINLGKIKVKDKNGNIYKVYPNDIEYINGNLIKDTPNIIQYTLDGIFIKKWESFTEIKKQLGYTRIRACCKGKRKTSHGSLWKFELHNNNINKQ